MRCCGRGEPALAYTTTNTATVTAPTTASTTATTTAATTAAIRVTTTATTTTSTAASMPLKPKSTPLPSPSYGTCQGHNATANAPCTHPAKANGYCGVHARQAATPARPSPSQQPAAPAPARLGPSQQPATGGAGKAGGAGGKAAVGGGGNGATATIDYGKCRGIKEDKTHCTNNAKANGYCGVHVKQAAGGGKPAANGGGKPAAGGEKPSNKKPAGKKISVKKLKARDSVTNAMGSGTPNSITRSGLANAKQHWVDHAQLDWPFLCCEGACGRPADRGGHVFITGKYTTVYIVPVCGAHNAVKQHFQVKAGVRAVEDPTIGIGGVVKMGFNHLLAGNFTLKHTKREP